jgi:hypothetical protein
MSLLKPLILDMHINDMNDLRLVFHRADLEAGQAGPQCYKGNFKKKKQPFFFCYNERY